MNAEDLGVWRDPIQRIPRRPVAATLHAAGQLLQDMLAADAATGLPATLRREVADIASSCAALRGDEATAPGGFGEAVLRSHQVFAEGNDSDLLAIALESNHPAATSFYTAGGVLADRAHRWATSSAHPDGDLVAGQADGVIGGLVGIATRLR